jgi:amino acid transporter
VMGSAILAGVFFVVTTYIEVLGFQNTGVSITTTEEPLAFLSQRIGFGYLGELVGIGALFSFFACILGTINPAARVAFMMARHGLFHASLGSAHAANRTPHIAVTVCSLIMFLIPAVMSMFNISLFESMGYLGAICSYGFLTVYILVSIAAPLYLRKIGQLHLRDLACSIIAVGFMMIPVIGSVGLPSSNIFPVPEAPYHLFPYLFLLYLVVTYGLFVRQRSRCPHMVKAMQHNVEEMHDRFTTEAVSISVNFHSDRRSKY